MTTSFGSSANSSILSLGIATFAHNTGHHLPVRCHIEAPRRKQRGTDFALAKSSAKPIFDPFLFIFFVLANLVASYEEPSLRARRSQPSLRARRSQPSLRARRSQPSLRARRSQCARRIQWSCYFSLLYCFLTRIIHEFFYS